MGVVREGTSLHTFLVEDDLWNDCAAAADRNGEPMSAVLRRALHAYKLDNPRWP